MPQSNYLGNGLLDQIFGDGDPVPKPTTVYVALFTAPPNAGGGGTEVTGGSYARAAITNNSTNFPDATGKSKSNGVAITFAQASAAWGTIVAVGIFDSLNAGTFLVYTLLGTPKTVAIGDTPSFSIGQLVFTAP